MKNSVFIENKKPQRNSKCYCGSGKKYKVCCGKTRRKTYGEVLTPIKLVNEMLDTLPETSWKLGKKVLDPATGRNGVFPIEYFKRVVKYNILNYDYEYISKMFWEEMMYMVEIQENAIVILNSNIHYFISEGRRSLDNMYKLDPNDTYKLFEHEVNESG